MRTENKANITTKVVNDNYFEALVAEFTPMINSLISQFTLEKGDYSVSKEDLFQEGYLALYEAWLHFDEQYGANFSTFAFVVIKRKLNRAFYAQLKRLAKEPISYDRYEKEDHVKEMGNFISENEFLYEGDAKEKLDELMKNPLFTDQDRKIIEMRNLKKSYKEIADELGITTKRVDNRITRIKRLLRRMFM